MSTYREGGLRGFYKGTTPAIVANVSENAVLFLSYGLCQDVVRYVSKMDKGAQLRFDIDVSAFIRVSIISLQYYFL